MLRTDRLLIGLFFLVFWFGAHGMAGLAWSMGADLYFDLLGIGVTNGLRDGMQMAAGAWGVLAVLHIGLFALPRHIYGRGAAMLMLLGMAFIGWVMFVQRLEGLLTLPLLAVPMLFWVGAMSLRHLHPGASPQTAEEPADPPATQGSGGDQPAA